MSAYDIFGFVIAVVMTIYGVVLTINPTIMIKKDYPVPTKFAKRNRVLGIIILILGIFLIVMNIRMLEL